MRNALLSTLFCFVFAVTSIAQEGTKPVFDYTQTKNEFAVDILPVFGGNQPISLFYRSNYQNSRGVPGGFRLNFALGNEFVSYSDGITNNQFENQTIHLYGLSIGWERQKIITDRILAFAGMDLGFAYGAEKLSNPIRPAGERDSNFLRVDTFQYRLTPFTGVKYHFNSRISVSAETGIELGFTKDIEINRRFVGGAEIEQKSTANSFGLQIVPLRALRLAYHF